MVLAGAVKPPVRGRIGSPWVCWTDMVGNDVQHYLDPQLVRGIYKRAIGFERAQMLFHRIEVHRAIAVIVVSGKIAIIVDRGNPEDGYAEFLEIRQMLLDPHQVAAVIGARRSAVIRTGGRKIVGWIAIGKAVGHDEIDRVIRTKTVITLFQLRRTSSFQVPFSRSLAFRRR